MGWVRGRGSISSKSLTVKGLWGLVLLGQLVAISTGAHAPGEKVEAREASAGFGV